MRIINNDDEPPALILFSIPTDENLVNVGLKVEYGRFTYRMIALLLEIPFLSLELYVRYDRRVMDLNTERNHLAIPRFVHIYTCNKKTTGCIRMFYVSNDCSAMENVYCLC